MAAWIQTQARMQWEGMGEEQKHKQEKNDGDMHFSLSLNGYYHGLSTNLLT